MEMESARGIPTMDEEGIADTFVHGRGAIYGLHR